jgi:hypothetical protein
MMEGMERLPCVLWPSRKGRLEEGCEPVLMLETELETVLVLVKGRAVCRYRNAEPEVSQSGCLGRRHR